MYIGLFTFFRGIYLYEVPIILKVLLATIIEFGELLKKLKQQIQEQENVIIEDKYTKGILYYVNKSISSHR